MPPNKRLQRTVMDKLEDGVGMEMAYRERWKAEIAELRRVLGSLGMTEGAPALTQRSRACAGRGTTGISGLRVGGQRLIGLVVL